MEMVARTYCARGKRDQNGGSVTEYEYGPYGAPYGNTTPLIFALHPYESGMGFYHAPNRNYSPASARWTTPDPAGLIDGPNVYGYVRGNPVLFIDAMGLRLSKCKCAADRAFNDAQEKYPGGYMDWTDHMRHCVASCDLRKEAGLLCSWAAGTYYEMRNSDRSRFDLESNRLGRRCGATAVNCHACCRQQWRDRYIDRSGPDRIPDPGDHHPPF